MNTREPPSIELLGGVECTVQRSTIASSINNLFSHEDRLDDSDHVASLRLGRSATLSCANAWRHETLKDIDWQWTDQRLGPKPNPRRKLRPWSRSKATPWDQG
jgi:hypothetical protein